MSAAEFVAYLQRRGIRVWADGDQLRYDAPKGALTPDLRAELVERKAELLALLGHGPGAAPAISPAPAGAAVPLSFGQQGVWLRQQLEPDNPFYNMPMAVWLSGSLDRAALERSLSAITRRHQILRTTFHVVDGAPVQVAGAEAGLRLPMVDLAGLPASRREAEQIRWIAAEARRPFDLTRRTFRAALLRLAEREHILLVIAHHLVFDNLSGGILIAEMQHLYAAFAAGRPAALPELPLQYADFAYWRQARLTDEALAGDLAYWRARLGGPLPTLALPTDWSRPAVQSFAGARQLFTLSSGLTRRLQALGREAGATLFMTLLAALNVLAARYTNQADIVVGTAIANRGSTATEGLIGLFADVLVLRADLSGDPSFRALLGRVRALTQEAYAHQDVPFERLVQELKPQRDPGYNPLFQVFFSLHSAPPPAPELPGLRLARLEIDTHTAKYDLDISITQEANRLSGYVEYNTSLFRAQTATRLVESFQTLLESIVAEPDRAIATLPLLTAADHELLRSWNDTQARYPADMCLHELVELQVAETPDRVAVVYGELRTNDERRTTNDEDSDSSSVLRPSSIVQLTYTELNRRANRLAHYLRGLGVGPDAPVGICIERSAEMVIGVLGILKAGGAYVPLDPALPAERLAFMIEDAQVRVIVTKDERRTTNEDAAPSFVVRRSSFVNLRVIDLESDWQAIARAPATNPISGAAPDNLAYVIHTSGSTGRPKGVALPHRPLMNLLAWHFAALSRAARTLQFASLGFDVSFHEMFSVCGSGGTLYIIGDAERVDMPALARFLHDHAIEKLTLPIVVLQQLAEAFHDQPRLLGSLRDLLATGEQLVIHPPMIELFDKLPRCTLHNHYGPSETHLVTTYTLPRPAATWPALPLIGRPIANVQAHILDRRLQPLPIGVPGELYFGGVCLARGYLNRPDLTAERFIPNPFAATKDERRTTNDESSHLVTLLPCHLVTPTGSRLYKTGDLARYRPDGAIEFLGRIDRQVKIRGYRVEPGEIEVTLRRHDAVREAVVVVREDAPGASARPEKRLVAYIVPTNDERRTTNEGADSSFVLRHSSFVAELRLFLEARLPAPLIPSAFVVIDRIPLNASGKVDWQRLPAPDPRAEETYSPPRSAVELKLAELWAELLAIDAPGIDDNFFELGGHSLKAAALVSRMRREFGAEVRLRDVFSAPTIRGLATTVARARSERFAAIPQVERQETYPLSSAQKRIFILQQIDPASMAYNLFDAFLITGDFQPERAAVALHTIIERHEILRTSFALTPAGPVQRVHEDVSVPLSQFEAGERDVETIARRFFAPFDLSRPPLLRIGLVRLRDDAHVLLFDMHHIVGDGVSLGILIREFVALYEGRAPAEVRTQYKDYASWHNALIESGALGPQEAYWLAMFADGVPVLNLPTDYPRPLIVTSEGDAVRFTLDARLTSEAKRLAARRGVTLYMLLFAAYAALLSRYTRQEDCVVGSPVSGRTHADLAGTLGMFVNMLAIRCRLAGGMAFSEHLRRTKETLVAALENQDYPFELLVEQVCRRRDTSRNPLVETTFDLWRHDDLWVESRWFTVEPYPFGAKTAKFDLLLDALDLGAEIQFDLQFSTQLFQRGMIERMASHYARILAEVVRDPEQRIGQFDILAEAEREQLLHDFGANPLACPAGLLIHRMVERQVEATPDAVAVVFEPPNDARRPKGAQTNDEGRTTRVRGSGGGGQDGTDQAPDPWHLTYGALNARANQLARRLRQDGLRRGELAGVLLNRSTELIAAILAVFKAGGAYVPIDPGYPPQRIRFILDDIGAPLILTEQRLIAAGLLDGVETRRIVDVAEAAVGALPAANLDAPNTPDDAAYAIYTSGTSGRPKGVLVSHANIVNAAFAWRHAYALDQREPRVLQVASAAFDLFTGDLVRTLTNGGRMVLCPLELLVELPELYRLIRGHRISFMESTPSLVIPLMEYVYQQRLPIDGLEQLVIGSDILNRDDYARLLERFGGAARIINSYGVTEGTVDSSYYAAASAGQLPATVSQGVPIGRPFPNSRLYVLSAHGLPQPIGVVGELCIGGAGVVRGYLGRPDLTAERFIPNPFVTNDQRPTTNDQRPTTNNQTGRLVTLSPCHLVTGTDTELIQNPNARRAPEIQNGERLYRTGDHARWLADGTLEFLGRYDSQVKIGGYRVEIGEIETNLLRHRAVKEAVVVDCLNRIGQKYLVGYVTLREPAEPAAIRQHLLEHLPGYMVPGAVRILEAIPLTPNGKIDRGALIAREKSEGVQREHQPPRSPTEAALARMWQEVLAVPQIGVSDSFFELGGNSLSLLTLYNRLGAAYDAGLSVAELFSCHTIELLAARIDRGRLRPEPAPQVRLEEQIFSILDDLERGQLDLADADQALEQLLP